MTDVFISFVHEDKAIAEAVKAILEYHLRPRVKVFMTTDQSQMLAGDDWLRRIKDELVIASVVILMMSKRSITKPWVNFEAGAAWIREKRVIPVCFGNQSKADLPHPYSQWQGIQIPEDENYLVATVARALGVVSPKGQAWDKVLSAANSKSTSGPLTSVEELGRNLSVAFKHWKDEP